MSLRRCRLVLELPAGLRPATRYLHVEREARARYAFPHDAFSLGGRLLQVDFGEAERITAAINAARQGAAAAGPSVSPAELGAAALLHELAHALLALHDWLPAAQAAVTARLGEPAAARLLADVRERFPPPSPPRDAEGGARLRPGVGGQPQADDGTTLEELLLLGLARENRALDPFAELFDLGPLAAGGDLEVALAAVHEVLAGVVVEPGGEPHTEVPVAPAAGPGDPTGAAIGGRLGRSDLLTLLRVPARRHPGSLLEQLEEALALWAPLLGGRFARLLGRALRSLDALREARTFVAGGVPAPPASFRPQAPGGGEAGEVAGEPAYSSDSDWMRRVVMVAKNAYVWLEQLSRIHGRPIGRLDEVPDEELGELAGHGFDTLWLVGVWQRSEASRTIKRLRGQPLAEASAYAIFDYVIDPELGGEPALAALSARAAAHGLRLASDMVPNHTGIDGRWVEERPEWFLQLERSPFAGYSFEGPDLTPGRAIEVRLEDGYFDGSDAAVVFQRRERATGEVRYLYHGNDGTLMPWNDTAQLDYLQAEVRAAVIETIVAVAQRFKVIRFDAAMTLVRRHVRRLWHPPPGEGGAVPSRSRHALTEDEFDAAMPREFWREVVEAVALRAPDTLLLAEAFWLLERYFVRALGVHRVYNSAFMHLLAAERNAEHRLLLRETLAEDPRDLERFVNYLTTPDEESAAETFGTGDKYFGAATMLATLPGLPLFGHGQVEGGREKYGMEFRAPRLDEAADQGAVERHRRVIAPLLARREEFASSEGFALLDVTGPSGEVLEDVYAYLFARTAARSRAALVLFNNAPRPAAGRLLQSSTSADGEGRVDLIGALGFGPGREAGELRARPHGSRLVATGDRSPGGGLEGEEGLVRWRVERLAREGLRVELAPYEALVYLDLVYVEGESAGEGAEAVWHGPADLVRRGRAVSGNAPRVGAGRARWNAAGLAGPQRDAARRRAVRRRRG